MADAVDDLLEDEVEGLTSSRSLDEDEGKASKKRKYEALLKKGNKKEKKPRIEGGSLLSSEDQRDFLVRFLPHSMKDRWTFPAAVLAGKTGDASDVPLFSALRSCNAGIKRTLKSGKGEGGCPFVVIVCGSAYHCIDNMKTIASKFHCKVSKLFAKHMKVTKSFPSQFVF